MTRTHNITSPAGEQLRLAHTRLDGRSVEASRDALLLARLLRMDDLAVVTVLTVEQEAARDLVRAGEVYGNNSRSLIRESDSQPPGSLTGSPAPRSSGVDPQAALSRPCTQAAAEASFPHHGSGNRVQR